MPSNYFPLLAQLSIAIANPAAAVQIPARMDVEVVEVDGYLQALSSGTFSVDVKTSAGDLLATLTWTAPGIQRVYTTSQIRLSGFLTYSVTSIGTGAAGCYVAAWCNAGSIITPAIATSNLLSGLVSYWKLDEASTGVSPVSRLDSAGIYANDLTDNNTVPSGSGIISNCASFNPVNAEYLSHVSNASLQTGDIDFTWTAWIQLADASANRFFISKGNMGGVLFEYGLWYDKTANRYKFWVSDNSANTGTAQADNFGAPPLNTWSFVAGWYDSAAKTVNISVNNGAVNSASYTFGVTANTSEFRIGADTGSGGSGSYWSGLIDETGFWKRVLTAGDLTALYNGGIGLTYPFS